MRQVTLRILRGNHYEDGPAVHIWGPRPVAEVLMEIRATGDEGAEIFAHHLTDAMALPDGLRQAFGKTGVQLAGIYVDVSPQSYDQVEQSIRAALEVLPFLHATRADRLMVGPRGARCGRADC